MTQVMGIQHIRDGVEIQTVVAADLGIIGIVGTAPGANPAVFPYDDPITFYSNDTAMLQSLGSTGTLADALKAISLQLSNAAVKVVVVRINPGANTAAAVAAIVGNEANRTGMWALLDAPDTLGVTPRVIIIPGYTSQIENGVASIAVTNGGSGYWADFPVTATGGSGTGFSGIAHVKDGVIQSVEIVNAGSGYSVAPTLVWTAGSGTGAAGTATLGSVANQICANIPTILDRLKAVFIPEGPTSSRAAAVSWLGTLPRSARILHPLRQDAKVLDVDGVTIVTKPLSPFAAALYSRRDSENEGIPSKSVANQSINGLIGLSPVIPLDITNDTTTGMSDIAAHFGIVVNGQAGVDGSLSDGGFIFWGTDTLSADTQWQFANVVRLRDYVEINQIKAERNYLGRENITIQTVQAIVNTMEDQLADLQRNGHIIGFRVGFDPEDNTAGELRNGILSIMFLMEEPSPLRLLKIRSRRYAAALDQLVIDIAVQLGTVA